MLQDRKIHCLHLSVVCIVHASFSPDILQAGAVKGLKKEEKRRKQDNTKQCVHCWHRCPCQGEEVRMVSESLDFTILRHANCTGSLQDKNNSYCKWQQKWLMEFVLLELKNKNNLTVFIVLMPQLFVTYWNEGIYVENLHTFVLSFFWNPPLKLKKNTPKPILSRKVQCIWIKLVFYFLTVEKNG